jgi:hypothetical protein
MDCSFFRIADYVDVYYTDTICISLLWISIAVKLDFLIGGKSVKMKCLVDLLSIFMTLFQHEGSRQFGNCISYNEQFLSFINQSHNRKELTTFLKR